MSDLLPFYKVNSRGFTLIEILIAIAILSFMALGIFNIVSQSSDTAERVTQEDQEFVQIVGALKKFDRDFSSIYSPLYFSPPMGLSQKLEESNNNRTPEEEPINQKYKDHNFYDGTTEDGHPIPAIFYEKNTELIFYTSSHKRKYENEKESNFSWVRYFIASNPEQSDLKVLYRQEIAENIFQRELDWGAIPAFTVINNIVKIDIFFWDSEKKEWSDSIAEESKYLGKALKIELIWSDKNGNENLVNKTYRILWPEFDPILDLQKKIAAKKGRRGLNNNRVNNPNLPPSDNEEILDD